MPDHLRALTTFWAADPATGGMRLVEAGDIVAADDWVACKVPDAFGPIGPTRGAPETTTSAPGERKARRR